MAAEPEPADAGSSGGSVPPPRLYTNADLAGLSPLPQQAAPLEETPGWDFVFSVIDRERKFEGERREEERKRQSAAPPPGVDPGYGHYVLPYYTGTYCCGGGLKGPTIIAPSSPYQSLRVRGIRTAVDLYQESVGNTAIRRQQIP
jgi:hypothetical protein